MHELVSPNPTVLQLIDLTTAMERNGAEADRYKLLSSLQIISFVKFANCLESDETPRKSVLIFIS